MKTCMGPRNRVSGWGVEWIPRGRAIFGGVCSLPLKYITLCKQQMLQQHRAADLSTGAASWRKMWFQNGLACRKGDKCRGDVAFRLNALTTCQCSDAVVM